MVLDDSKWFQAQARIRAEMAMEVDEMKRIYPSSVMSDFEFAMMGEIAAWIMLQPRTSTEMKNAIDSYWNERLN